MNADWSFKMFCFPSVGTVLWYIVPWKHSHTSIASDLAFTILYKSVTRSAMDVMTEVGQIHSIHSIQRTLGYKLILLQTGTKYFQDPLLCSGNLNLRPANENFFSWFQWAVYIHCTLYNKKNSYSARDMDISQNLSVHRPLMPKCHTPNVTPPCAVKARHYLHTLINCNSFLILLYISYI